MRYLYAINKYTNKIFLIMPEKGSHFRNYANLYRQNTYFLD